MDPHRFRHPGRIPKDVEIVSEVGPAATEDTPDPEEARRAGRLAVSRASLELDVPGERPLYGTKAFFRRAADQLWLSTRLGLELAGAVYARTGEQSGRTILVGLKRRGSGLPGRVAIAPTWGSILWHTHPGARLSLAAFSDPDLTAAQMARKPLLVIGFGGLSPDVLTTFALPLGLKGLLVAGGVKGLIALERSGKLKRRLLSLGVAVRVCYPSGRIRPVLRQKATPLAHAVDDVSFTLDRSVGAIERAGQRILRELVGRATGSR